MGASSGRSAESGAAEEARTVEASVARILVVEDSPATRTFVRSALEGAPGFEDAVVVEASSGFDALRLLPRGNFELIITDINMPDINGLELIKFVRASERHREVPVVIISTQGSEKDRARGLALGANAFLVKPFTPDELRRAARESLGTKAPGQAG